ncbi:hypothetical protein K466DRAFT_607842 [Polyporus arcularius HHB13444]|uniref:SNF2 N-terminal domain-containing protein n=1 Tax=Polyporus arcularius HHB13444 TaxID=1314778 RepID=A0A5C3NLZ5_9APHY|nr:hypothetical protein K466DRAFT_607842 [Polyporus arcularius HHB13444]
MIVVPTCLKEQWEGEIHRFLRWGAFDLIPYQLNFREGPRKIVWDTIMTPRGDLKLSDKIILATITAVTSDGLHFYSSGFGTSFDLPPVDTGVTEASRAVTAYTHDYGLLVIDEIGQYRNVTKWSAALKGLRLRAFGAVGMTATPIVNSPLDVWHLGQILDIKGTDDPTWEAEMRTEILAANRKATKEFQKLRETDNFVQSVSESKVDLPEKKAQLQSFTGLVSGLRAVFSPHVIRRTIHSVDWQGNAISGLDKYNEVVLTLEPFPREATVLEEHAQATVDEYGSTLPTVAKNFGHVSFLFHH